MWKKTGRGCDHLTFADVVPVFYEDKFHVGTFLMWRMMKFLHFKSRYMNRVHIAHPLHIEYLLQDPEHVKHYREGLCKFSEPLLQVVNGGKIVFACFRRAGRWNAVVLWQPRDETKKNLIRVYNAYESQRSRNNQTAQVYQ